MPLEPAPFHGISHSQDPINVLFHMTVIKVLEYVQHYNSAPQKTGSNITESAQAEHYSDFSNE